MELHKKWNFAQPYVPGGDCYEHLQNKISTSQSRT